MNEEDAALADRAGLGADASDSPDAPESTEPVEADQAIEPEAAEPADAEPVYEPVETRTTVEVGLVRAVRYGPIMIAGGVLGALVAVILALVFPVQEDAMYTVGQVAGFVAVLGGAIGIALGGLLAMLLNLSAKRQQGTAMAVLTDVR